MQKFLNAIVWLAAVLAGLGTVLAALDTYYWAFETFAHFVLQYILISTLLLPVVLWRRRWLLVFILLMTLGININEVAMIRRDFSHPRESCDAGKTITILQSNVYYRNWNLDAAFERLREAAQDVDIVVFNEFEEEWRERALEEFSDSFPHHFITWIKGDIESFAIFSKEPFEVRQHSGRIHKNAHLRLLFPSYGLTFAVYHGYAPITELGVQERNYELMRIAQDFNRMSSPALVMGDFNQTPYATAMQEAMREGRLYIAHFPHGLAPTWPKPKWALPFGIPIDHLLANDHIRICKRRVIDVPGTDHGAVRTVLQPLPSVPEFK